MEDGKMIKILYEDNHLLVVVKPVNMLVQKDITNDPDLLTELKKYLKEKYHKTGNVYLGLVHRLDRMVGGVMVLAKTSKCASRLSKEIQDHEFKKTYLAVVEGKLKDKDTYIDYLLKDEKLNKTVVNPKGKYSKLDYELIKYKDNYSLVKINLHTGRSHQIRVQFASRNHPLYNDHKYNKNVKEDKPIALWSYSISFHHPVTKELMTFKYLPKKDIWSKYLESNLNVFTNYVKQFDLNIEEIRRKYHHSIRVSKIAKDMALSLNLTNEEVEVMEFIGLVHDIGRFKQYSTYHTFKDNLSINHALLGLEILFKDNYINNFKNYSKYNDIISIAIKNHNQYRIDENTQYIEMFCKILRDADKIDILNELINREILLNEDESKVSEEVGRQYLNNESIKSCNIKTKTDTILSKFAFIFDINYPYTKNYLKENKVIEELYNNLKYKDNLKVYYEYLKKYMKGW